MSIRSPLIGDNSVDVWLVTSSDQPTLPSDDQYLLRALLDNKLSVCVEPWDQPVSSTIARVLVLRAAWNSHLNPPKFLRWLNAHASRSIILNGQRTIRWNFDKSYLIELSENGFATVPTRLLERAESTDIAQALSPFRDDEIVVKPRFGANAFGTLRLDRSDLLVKVASHFETFGAFGGILIQPFVGAVETERERSLVFIDQRFSHALYRTAFNKKPTRQSPDNIHHPTPAEHEYCESLLNYLPDPPTYARFDLVPVGGKPALMELELIDPSLFFATRPECAEQLAHTIAQTVLGKPASEKF